MRQQPVEHEYTDSPERLNLVINQLADAIHELAGLRPQQITLDNGQTKTIAGESRYTEIATNITGRQGTQNGGVARSMPLLWIDAYDWLTKVDTKVKEWAHTTGTGTTPNQLYALLELAWRPQDTHQIHEYTKQLKTWSAKADQLIQAEDTHRWELTAPCPACGTKTIHRPDSTGEYVRQAALQLDATGCTCQHCKYTWAPEYYQHLARVLDCPLPAGVLE